MPFRAGGEINTLAADVSDLRAQLNQVSMVTESDPRQGPAGSATATSLAWDTLRTNILTALGTQNVGNVNRAQDLIDRAPTLRFRGTP